MSRTTAQLEAAALAVPCTTHGVPAGAACPDGGACIDRYGLPPQQWAGWFERDGASPATQAQPGCVDTALRPFGLA